VRTGDERGGSGGTGFDEVGKSKWRWLGIKWSANGPITSYMRFVTKSNINQLYGWSRCHTGMTQFFDSWKLEVKEIFLIEEIWVRKTLCRCLQCHSLAMARNGAELGGLRAQSDLEVGWSVGGARRVSLDYKRSEKLDIERWLGDSGP